MREFKNLRDAGRRLAPLISSELEGTGVLLAPILPNGVPIAQGILDRRELPTVALAADRAEDGVRIHVPALPGGATVVVLDDGVETGTAARAAAHALREAGAARIVLAVPVCPREAMADLALRFDEVVAVSTPLVRRSLTWHYEDFDTIDEAEALRLLGDLSS